MTPVFGQLCFAYQGAILVLNRIVPGLYFIRVTKKGRSPALFNFLSEPRLFYIKLFIASVSIFNDQKIVKAGGKSFEI
jgi:hypothetical protein